MKKMKSLCAIPFATLTAVSFAFAGCGTNERPKDNVKDNEVFVYNESGQRVEIDNDFVTIDGNTYYAQSNVVVKGYRIIGDKLYHFSEDSGIMSIDCTLDVYTFGQQGYATSDFMQFSLSGSNYFLINDSVVNSVSVGGNILESDHDTDDTNNEVLPAVQCTIQIYNQTFSVKSDENGDFVFDCLPAVENYTIHFYLENYIEADYSVIGTGSVTDAKIVLDKNVSNVLSGRIVQADSDNNLANNAALSGAKITLERTTSTNPLLLETNSDSNGNYSFPQLTAGVYILKIELDGYVSITQTIQIRANQTTIQNAVLEAIPAPAEGEEQVTGGATGTIINARNGAAISGLTIYVREGINNVTGEIICTVYTDSNGSYVLSNLAPGNYTAQVVDERELSGTEEEIEEKRFGSLPFTVKILAGETISNQNATTSNNEGLNPDSIRIVLTWGSSPSDLDSHLYAGRYHVSYSNKSLDSANLTLDVDDTSAYGPETITVANTKYSGNYTYYVHDYSNKSNSYSAALGNSGAIVNVYFGGAAVPAYTFYVPQGSGTTWKVFTYNKDTDEFIIHNQLLTSLPTT